MSSYFRVGGGRHPAAGAGARRPGARLLCDGDSIERRRLAGDGPAISDPLARLCACVCASLSAESGGSLIERLVELMIGLRASRRRSGGVVAALAR